MALHESSGNKLSAVTFISAADRLPVVEVCLETLKFADEIIVVSHHAPPPLISLAKKYTKQIFPCDSDDFSVRHNLGREKASGNWLLYVDCDERVSVKLAGQIKDSLNYPSAGAYQLRRVNYYLGKESIFGDRYPDFVTRLFKKDKLVGWEGEIHESSKVSGKIGKLDAPLYHLTHRDIFSMTAKTTNFAGHEASLRYRAGHPPVVWWRLIRVFVTELYTRLVKYQGWRQGTEGWIDGMFQAFSLFIVYARLWELQRRPTLEQTYLDIDRKITAGEI